MNPFADYNSLVFGSAFVGRSELLSTLDDRIIHAPSPASLALIGPKRIGKSSVAWHGLIHRKKELNRQQMLPVWLPMGAWCVHAEDFFIALVKGADEELCGLGVSDPILDKLKGRCVAESTKWMDMIHAVLHYFVQMRALGWRTVFVVDEFDYARGIFQGRPEAFQGIRELANQPRCKVTFVTTSRRLLHEIERKADPSGSTLAQIMHSEHLSCFDGQELIELVKRIESTDLVADSNLLGFILTQTGGHPFLASQLLYQVAREWLLHGKTDFDHAMNQRLVGFFDYYRDTVELLEEDGSLKTLLEILFGPVVQATKADAVRLTSRGLLRTGPDGYYHAFSAHFTDYLRAHSRSVDLWPLWSQAECALREIVADTMRQLYGANSWADEMVRQKPRLGPIVDNWRELMQRERHSVGSQASQDLLDFTYPADLWHVIKAHFRNFSPIFGKDERHWGRCFETLAFVRTRLAHNRPSSVEQEDKDHAEAYCREIIKAAHRWRTGSSGLTRSGTPR